MRLNLGRRLGRGAAALGLVVMILAGGGAVPAAAAVGPKPAPTPTSPGKDPRPPGSATGTDLSKDKRYQGKNLLFHPLLLPIVDMRLDFHRRLESDRDEAFNAYRNGAVELINPVGLPTLTMTRMLTEKAAPSADHAYWRNSLLRLDSVTPFLPRTVETKLRGAGVTQLLAVSALNLPEQEEATSSRVVPREHSEAVIQRHLQDYGIPPSARVLGASERQQCPLCAGLYPQDMPTYFAWRYGLSVEETAEQQRQVVAVGKRTDQSAKWRAEETRRTKEKFTNLTRTRAAAARQQIELGLDAAKKLGTQHPNSTASAALQLFAHPLDPIGKPCPPAGTAQMSLAAFRRAGPCDESTGESSPAGGDAATSTGLGQILSGGPSTAPGGIDFTTMELRYLADPGDGSGLQYSFEAGRDPLRGDARTSTGMDAATLSSDAFFVWLSLRPSDFWVNLNPDEPDRIVDARLGSTDAGRVLLQADLRMKKTVGTLIHPDTGSGKELWNRVKGQCLSFRTWIVPAPASVHQDGDKLYILDAPLDVKMDTQYLKSRGVTRGQSCPRQEAATEEHNEQVYRTLVLPELKRAINTGPDYADLRRVYLARVAAEWYRNLSRTRHTTYGALVDRGDARAWPGKTSWKPTDTFDEYVKSYTKGEFKVTRHTTQGNAEYVTTYTYGGVDLSTVPLRDAPAATFAANVKRSLRASDNPGPGDSFWLGAPTPRQAAGLDAGDGALSATALALRVLPALLVSVAGLLWWRSRRLGAAGSASPLRRAAVSGPRILSRTRRPR
ncbi:hypothetical protein QMK19_37180 [Streptomyces sp. H10-C2]|uniref:hypothetical protein n=1 Tax=unclassified Streptomyces TaxID=2593676 RepID=UPI0024BA9517|nr:MULTISPECIES: hypothetical protein [unclassified Streptomyces]MDJ0346653.1 hypothetical protein [Streptomyces sp. PH10-H1]MDJ0375092.1 hypothetical protein [Streptomyces sp. H10-C2]